MKARFRRRGLEFEQGIDPETGMDTPVETNRHAPPSCRISPCSKFMLGLPTNLATVILMLLAGAPISISGVVEISPMLPSSRQLISIV